MSIYDFEKSKLIEVTSASGEPTISRALCFKITGGDDSTTGTGEVVLDWSNISSQADIGVYDENDNLLDYYFESFDATNETAVIWVYKDWVRDGSVQAKIAYGNGPSDQSVAASTVFDKESNLQAGYLFNESSGDLLDVTSNNNDGTVYGATQGESGIVGGAYSLDGQDDYISLPNSLGNVLKYKDWSTHILAKENSGNNGYRFNVREHFDDEIRFTLEGDVNFDDDSVGTSSVSPNNALNDDSWHLQTVIIDSSQLSLYIDSNNDDNADVSGLDTLLFDGTNDPVLIGTRGNGGYPHFGGEVCCFLIYDTQLPQDDVVAFYAATKFSPDFFSQQGVVVTDSPTNVTSTSAILNGTLSDLEGNSSLDVYFEWGTDTNYGNTTATQTISSVPTSFSADISGLSALTTYHYRAVATDGSNYWYGGDVSFNAADLRDVDETQSEFQDGTLTDVEADSGDYLRLADTNVLSFDGSDDYVDMGSASETEVSGSVTIECWINCDVVHSDWAIIAGRAEWSNEQYDLRTDSNGYFVFLVRDSVDYYMVSSGIKSTNGWQHFKGIFDSANKKASIEVDGVEQDSVSTNDSSLNIGAEGFTVGARYYSGSWQDFSEINISDLRVWGEVHSTSDYDKRLTGDETNLLGYWKFDEGSGDITYDSAGSNDGTINGASYIGPIYDGPVGLNGQGNRVVQLDLSSLSTYSDSLIEWTATLNGQSLTIETRYSLDGGSSWSSWQTATNGDPIPGLSGDEDFSNALLECRETLSTSDTTATPQLERRAIFLVEDTSTGYTLAASAGSHTVVGSTAGLILDRIIKANSSSYAVTGSSSTLFLSKVIDAVAGSYSLTGNDAALAKDFLIIADSAAYVVSGSDATLTHIISFVLSADPGIYAITGQTARLLQDLILQADSSSYTSTGQTATLAKDFLLVTDSGSYLLSGKDATLTYLGEIVLNAEPGLYDLSGVDATLSYIRGIIMDASAGTYALSGTDNSMFLEKVIQALAGTYQVSGSDFAALLDHVIQGLAGQYSVDGSSSQLAKHSLFNLDPGSYTLSGKDAVLALAQIMSALSGSYAVDGTDAALLIAEKLFNAEVGAYNVAGEDLELILRTEGLAKGELTISFSAETAKAKMDGQTSEIDFDGSPPEIIIKPK